MAIPRAKKKKVIRSRTRSGVAATPTDKGYGTAKYYFHNEVDKKDYSSCIKTYIKGNYDRGDVKAIESNPEYKFTMYSHYACIAFWLNSGLEKTEEVVYWEASLKKHLGELLEKGRDILTEKLLAAKDSDKVISLTPQQRLANKIGNTIMQDLMDLEDSWIEGEDGDIDLYSLFKKHGLAGSSVSPVRSIVENWLLDYEDAYLKRCDQAVEGYSHLTKTKLKKRVNLCKEMLNDLDRIKSAARANRAVKAKQPRAADKQISRIKYKKEDSDFKLVSIPPVKIIGSIRLYAFNTKTRTLHEYVTESPNGFEVKGTTIQNFDKVSSRSVKLRKPDEVLPIILNKSSTQIRKEWDKLKTKVYIPNGRINNDTILLRVMDK